MRYLEFELSVPSGGIMPLHLSVVAIPQLFSKSIEYIE